MQFETLEIRTMLSSTLFNGVLTINGTSKKDIIQISVANSSLSLTENHVLTTFAVDSVTSIQGNMAGGNDIVLLDPSVSIPITVAGDAGNDTIVGGSGNDSLVGGSGNDSINGGDGDDELYDDAGSNFLSGDAGSDNLKAGAGADSMYGGSGDDFLQGGAGNDLLDGGDGNDTLHGLKGNDTMVAGLGSDLLDGADGTDTADYSARTESFSFTDWGVNANDSAFANTGTDATVDDDKITPATEIVKLGSGNDHLECEGAFDSSLDSSDPLRAELAVTHTLDAGPGDDVVEKVVDTSMISASEHFVLGDGNDAIYDGNDPSPSIDCGDGNDNVTIFYSTLPPLSIAGGPGVDEIYVLGADFDTLDLRDFPDVENATTDDSRTLIGNDLDNTLIAYASSTLIGNGGDDNLVGSPKTLDGMGNVLDSGADLIDGGDGNDVIVNNDGEPSADTVIGGAGMDTAQYDGLDQFDGVETFFGTPAPSAVIQSQKSAAVALGAPSILHINGTSGKDTITVSQDAAGAITVNVNGAVSQYAAGVYSGLYIEASGGKDYINLEPATGSVTLPTTIIGGSGNDTIIGGTGPDLISGGGGSDNVAGGPGNDFLDGAAVADAVDGGQGNDTVIGGTGTDTLTGGPGDDILNPGTTAPRTNFRRPGHRLRRTRPGPRRLQRTHRQYPRRYLR